MFDKNPGLPWVVMFAVVTAVLIVIGVDNWSLVVSYDKKIDFAMQVITIIAFILAFFAYLDAKAQGLKLGSIYDSVYTKYIGTFPKHIELLVKHINASNHRIYIAWDAVDIGSYVNPPVHEEFLSAITNAIDRIKVSEGNEAEGIKFLLLSKPMAVSSAGGVYVISKNSEKEKEFCRRAAKNEAFLDSLRGLFKRYADSSGLDFDKDIVPFTNFNLHGFTLEGKEKAFETYQLCYHDFVALRLHYAGIDVRILKNENNPAVPPPNFFWVADNGGGDAQGGFLLPASRKSAPAFMTSDPNLIGNLSDIFKEHFDGAKPYIHEGNVAE